MELGLCIGILVLTFVIGKVFQKCISNESKLFEIPGPKGWPLVGNALQTDPTGPYKTFADWSRKYGDMFKIKIFRVDTIVLNDFESVHEMLTSEACSSRPHSFRLDEIMYCKYISISYDNFSVQWNEKKKAVLRSLNAHGSGLTRIESVTLESIDELFTDIFKATNQYTSCIDMRPHLHKCIASVITTLYYGWRLDDCILMELLELERSMMKLASPAGLVAFLDFLPCIQHLPIRSIQSLLDDAKRYWDLLEKNHMAKENRHTSDDDQCILDILMQFVNKITKKQMTHAELLGLTGDVIGAGFITSTASMYSLILILINFPDIQEKMYEEIQHVTNGQRPRVTDRAGMIYVKAVMEELFRYVSILPLGVPHRTGEDTVLCGKSVPKGTNLLGNLWALNHDEKNFDEPWKFKPERYLTDDGKMLPSDHAIWKHTIPFSAGKRACPGEGLARNRIFLVIVSLLQKYKFLPEDETKIPTCDPHVFDSALVLIPQMYKVKISKRPCV